MYLIESKSIKLSFEDTELQDIAFDILKGVERSAKEHWLYWYFNDNDKPTEQGFIDYIKVKEAKRVEKIKLLFGIVGMLHVYESLDHVLKEIYRKREAK